MNLLVFLTSLLWSEPSPSLIDACEFGTETACFEASLAFDRTTPAGLFNAARYGQIACESGIGSACFNVGIWKRELFSLIENSEEVELPDGQRLYADIYRRDTLLAGSTASFAMGCERQHVRACAQAATAYRDGTGVEIDPGRMLELQLLGCEAGAAELCRWAGTSFASGDLGEPDYDSALRYFLRACSDENRQACTNAKSVMNRGNLPNEEQYAQAIQALRNVCEDGSEPLGLCAVRDYLTWQSRSTTGQAGVDRDLVLRIGDRCAGGNYATGGQTQQAAWCLELSQVYMLQAFDLSPGQRLSGQLRYSANACELGDQAACGYYASVVASLIEGQTRNCEEGNQPSCDFVELARDPQLVDDYFIQVYGLVSLSEYAVESEAAP